MIWTIKDLPQNIQNKPSHILEKGLAAANKALLNGKSNVEATLVCLGTTRSVEQALNPIVEPTVPSHVALLKAKDQPKNNIHRAFLGKNALPSELDRTLVSAEFNSRNQLVLTFDTGEQITTNSIEVSPDVQQSVAVSVNPIFDFLRFNPDLPEDIPYEEGLVFYDSTDHCLVYYNDDSNVKVSISREQMVRVYNNNAFIIPDGYATYINGTYIGTPTVGLTIASSKAAVDPTIGICTGTIQPYSYGYICISGNVNGIDTSAYAPGTILYISGTTAGTLTSTPLMQPNYNVEVATVLVQDATAGSILVRVDKKPWFPSLRLVHLATSALPTVPTVFIPSTLVYNDGFTYDSLTGEVTVNNSAAYSFSLTLNVLAGAANKHVSFYLEVNAGSGWVPSLYSGRRQEILNNAETQLLLTDNRYIPEGAKVRLVMWADAGVSIITQDLPGTVPGTVKLPAFTLNIA